jgi:predicted MFS family arabinose efflux permease
MTRALRPIFLIVLVDVLGFTIAIPLLPYYGEHFGASPFEASALVATFALCALISTPIIGGLSDRFGRRPLLLFSLAGTCVGFLVLARASSLWMVFAGRIIDGLSAGNLAVAQAYIADHTAPQDRARAYGMVGAAVALAFLLGPALVLVLGSSAYVALFSTAAGLSALSLLATHVLVPRDSPRGSRSLSLAGLWRSVRRRELVGLYAHYGMYAFAFAWFIGGFALFAERRFTVGGRAWNGREVVLLIAYSGVLGIAVQGALIGPLVRRFTEARVVIAGFVGAALAYAAMALASGATLVIAGATISAFGNGVLRPVITSRITQRVSADEQGHALGVAEALYQTATVIAPIAGGMLIERSWLGAWALVPLGVAVIGVWAAWQHDRVRAPLPASQSISVLRS